VSQSSCSSSPWLDDWLDHKQTGTSFNFFFLLKVKGILVVVERFSLESFILVLVKRALVFLNMGLESLLVFDSTLFTLHFDSDLIFSLNLCCSSILIEFGTWMRVRSPWV